jgi:hypothetical protein
VNGPRTCPRVGGGALRTLFVGLCLLFLVALASAATNGGSAATPPQVTKSERVESFPTRLARKLTVARKYRSTIRFFTSHRWLLSSAQHEAKAETALRRARTRLRRVTKNITALRRALRKRGARRLASAPPKAAICNVFGRRYCGQALSVAWCESRHSTTAQNGQYLGLFQMGSSERRLFGHGASARKQAAAAHRYFVVSGRDWSPWGCKPSFAYS